MRRSRPEPSEEGPGDFGSYIHAKRQKRMHLFTKLYTISKSNISRHPHSDIVSEQYATAASSAISPASNASAPATIFSGVVAFVSNSIFCTISRDGKDQPIDHREISRLLQLHGGRLLPKHDKDMTHFGSPIRSFPPF